MGDLRRERDTALKKLRHAFHSCANPDDPCDTECCERAWAYEEARKARIERDASEAKFKGLEELVKRQRPALNNLLAIIHRDGGHHTEAVGIEQSVKDAHERWAGLQALREAALGVGHKGDCPAIERLQSDRVTMAASGPCNCWLGPLKEALDGNA